MDWAASSPLFFVRTGLRRVRSIDQSVNWLCSVRLSVCLGCCQFIKNTSKRGRIWYAVKFFYESLEN